MEEHETLRSCFEDLDAGAGTPDMDDMVFNASGWSCLQNCSFRVQLDAFRLYRSFLNIPPRERVIPVFRNIVHVRFTPQFFPPDVVTVFHDMFKNMACEEQKRVVVLLGNLGDYLGHDDAVRLAVYLLAKLFTKQALFEQPPVAEV